MWMAFIAGWLLGSASLYSYMILTAKPPEHDECLDCSLPGCGECPYQAESIDTAQLRAA